MSCLFSCLQTRGAMSEWLKELSLLDHLLHGLFKFIGETTSLPGRKEAGLEGISSIAVHFFQLFQLTLQHCCLIRMLISSSLLSPPFSFCPPPLLFLSHFIAFLLFNTTPKLLPYPHTITPHTCTPPPSHIHTVTLSPSLEQLAYQAYLAVAQQLPSLLRQWYLSVDRQTSTMVNK